MRYTNKQVCISVREICSDKIAFIDINKYGKRAVVKISTVVLQAHHVGCQSVLSNMIFLNIYLNTFFGVLNSGNKSVMRFFFFWKAFKFNVHFKNVKKKKRKKIRKYFFFVR